jgi:hypothetical protein
MKFIKTKIIATVIIGSLLFGCESKPDTAELIDQLVVSTSYDTEANFDEYATYAIPTDTIWLYSNAIEDTLLIQNSNSTYPRPVIDAIRSNMEASGFTRVKRNENPDLGVNVSIVHDYSIYQELIYGGYGGYGGGYYGYGSSYYYPSYVSTSTTSNGMLIVELVDLKNKGANNKVNVLWTANMGDVMNTLDLEKQSVDAINQSFIQSTYLGRE